VIQIAGLASDQKLMSTAAALSSAGKTMTQLYCVNGEKSQSRELVPGILQSESATHPVVPSHSKSESGSDEATSERNVAAGDGEVGDHLTERDHDRITERTDGGVTDKETGGTTVSESVGSTYIRWRSARLGDRLPHQSGGKAVRTEEETSSDDTPDRDHLDMAPFPVRGESI
jgi:hypothetical protein